MASSEGAAEDPERRYQLPEPTAQEWQLQKHLLLLATLVVSVTYVAGLNPPGGVWQENGAGHRAGDPILRDTDLRRFLAFYYCNATALAASVVVIFLLLLRNPRKAHQLAVLRVVMVLDLLGLMGAYLAGTCREKPAIVYAVALVVTLCSYVGLHVMLPSSSSSSSSSPAGPGRTEEQGVGANVRGQNPPLVPSSSSSSQAPAGAEPPQGTQEGNGRVLLEPKERRKVLLLLATFATAITYVAGLSSPGGYWDRAESRGAYHPGDALVEVHHKDHFKIFFYCNTTAFIASLFVVVLLLDKNLSEMTVSTKSVALYVFILGALLALLGAYATGSCRNTDTSVYVVSLIGAVLAFIFLVMKVIKVVRSYRSNRADAGANQQNHTLQMAVLVKSANGGGGQAAAGNDGTVVQGNATAEAMDEASGKVKSLILLLATLSATITYQAGLDPPGGVWPDDRDGHRAGHPVLLSAYAKRYMVFFYCNSSAFVVSLAAIIMLQQNEKLVKSHTHITLLVSMMLGIFALMGAYAAGSCRDLTSSICIVVATVLALVIVIFFKLSLADMNMQKHALKKRHKRLLLLAVLVATVTYQAGLTPPGGFWLEDNGDHAADNAVLLENYPRPFQAFFYCNTVSFIMSIVLLLFLVNRYIYNLAIKCYALDACIVMALVGLMVAYAAGSARRVRTSIYVSALVAGVVVAFIAVYTLVPRLFPLEEQNVSSDTVAETLAPQGEIPASRQEEIPTRPQGEIPASRQEEIPTPPQGEREARPNYREEYNSRKYLMLLGILAASVTYQAGLAPPGGVWQDDGDHGDAGDPLLRDIDGRRYRVFFYSNSTSFVASVVVIALLLEQILRPHKPIDNELLLLATKTVVVLDLVCLLVAYAAGSTREWEDAVTLPAMLLLCMAIHVAPLLLSSICNIEWARLSRYSA